MGGAAVALATLLQQCAPNVGSRTMTAIVRVESRANPFAIHDNATGHSFAPRTATEAVETASALVDAGHSVDLGLAQVNSANLPKLGLRVRDAFDPCTNLRAGATILTNAYAAASSRFRPGPYALRRAIGAYNTGSIFAGDAYVQRILLAAGLPSEDDRRVPDLEAGPNRLALRAGVPFARTSAAKHPALSEKPPVRIQAAAPRTQLSAGSDPFASPILVTNTASKPDVPPQAIVITLK